MYCKHHKCCKTKQIHLTCWTFKYVKYLAVPNSTGCIFLSYYHFHLFARWEAVLKKCPKAGNLCLPLPSNIGLGMHKRRCKITWPLKDYFSSSRKKDTKIFILQFLPHRLHLQLNLKDESVLCFLLRGFSFESYDKTQCWILLKKSPSKWIVNTHLRKCIDLGYLHISYRMFVVK